MPNFVSKLFSATLGRLLDSSEPVDQNLQTFGATLELQRQENLERLEHQLLMQSIRNSQNGRNIHIGRPQPQVNKPVETYQYVVQDDVMKFPLSENLCGFIYQVKYFKK